MSEQVDLTEPGSPASVGQLFSEVSNDLSTLLRQEVELAKAEIKQEATKAATGAGMLEIGRAHV